jgi:short-chain fatty acids transporter
MIVGTGLSGKLAHVFTSASSHDTFSLLAAGYSALLGLFIPSGGSKWIVEAPYVLQAAIAHQVHLGWVVQIYNVAEAMPNLINPFWMLPLLGILRLKARDCCCRWSFSCAGFSPGRSPSSRRNFERAPATDVY